MLVARVRMVESRLLRVPSKPRLVLTTGDGLSGGGCRCCRCCSFHIAAAAMIVAVVVIVASAQVPGRCSSGSSRLGGSKLGSHAWITHRNTSDRVLPNAQAPGGDIVDCPQQ